MTGLHTESFRSMNSLISILWNDADAHSRGSSGLRRFVPEYPLRVDRAGPETVSAEFAGCLGRGWVHRVMSLRGSTASSGDPHPFWRSNRTAPVNLPLAERAGIFFSSPHAIDGDTVQCRCVDAVPAVRGRVGAAHARGMTTPEGRSAPSRILMTGLVLLWRDFCVIGQRVLPAPFHRNQRSLSAAGRWQFLRLWNSFLDRSARRAQMKAAGVQKRHSWRGCSGWLRAPLRRFAAADSSEALPGDRFPGSIRKASR